MLQTIRDKITGWFAYVFLGAIAVVFIFWGVEMRSVSGANYAAKVNGERIPLEVVNQAWQNRQNQLQQTFRGEIPEPLKKSQQEEVLTEQIRTQLLTQQVDKLGYRVSTDELQKAVASIPELQVDGKFSIERYDFMARQQGMSTAQLDRDIRRRLIQRQLVSGIVYSSFVTPAEAARREALEGEKRELDYVLVPVSQFMAGAVVSDADVQAYYDANKADFMTDEKVDIEYIELKLADVEKDVAVTDEALREYYEQSKARLTTPERRLGRHILITVGDGVDDAAAKKKAEEVLAKVKGGGDFAALAKEFSQDPISAAKGGQLDWANRGENMGPFDQALFAMTQGEIRGPVKTPFGYHVIRLDTVEGGDVKSFEAARAELTKEYTAEKAQTAFYDKSQKMGDEAFSALTELETTAKSLGLTVHKLADIPRIGGVQGTVGADPKVLETVFTQEAIEKRQNSSLLQVADDHAVVVRVAAHHAPEQKPLPVVKSEIESRLKVKAARDAAAKKGSELLAKLEAGADWVKTLDEFKVKALGKSTVSRSESSVPGDVRQRLFAVPRTAVTAEKPAYRGIPVENGDYAVLKVSAIVPGKIEAGSAEANARREQTAQSVGNEEFSAYLLDIEKRADIERNPKTFE